MVAIGRVHDTIGLVGAELITLLSRSASTGTQSTARILAMCGHQVVHTNVEIVDPITVSVVFTVNG